MRILAIVTLTVSTIIVVAALITIVFIFKSEAYRCTSEECKEAAISINKSMDKSINPCEDIYKFTCGNYDKVISKPPLTTQYSLYGESLNHLHFKLNSQLRNSSQSKSEPLEVVKQVYESCIEEKHSGQSLKHFIDLMRGNGDVKAMLKQLLSFGESILFTLKVAPDPFISNKYIIWLLPPKFNIEAKDLRQAKVNSDSKQAVQEYIQYMTQESQNILSEEEEAVKQAVEFEQSLASLPALTGSTDFKSNILKFTLDNLQKELPQNSFNYLEMINSVAENVGSETRLTPQSEVIVSNLNYFKEMPDTINKVNQEVVESYLILRFIQSYGFALNNDFIRHDFNYMKLSKVDQYQFDLKFRCMDFLIETVPELMGKVYSNEVQIRKEEIDDVQGIYNSLLTTLKESIDQSSWVNQEAKDKLKRKLDKINLKIGFPKWIVNEPTGEWEKRYPLDPKSSQGASSHQMTYLKSKSTKLSLDRLVEKSEDTSKVDPDNEWTVSPASLKVYYDQVKMSLEVPAAVIKESLYYNHKWPNFMKYARLGTLLSHHLNHAIDSTGINFNEEGKIDTWLKMDMSNELKNKMYCFVTKYAESSSEITEEIAKKSLDENFSDCEALRTSFRTFDKNNGYFLKLPEGFVDEYSPRQLFILSYISSLCHVVDEKTRRVQAESNQHLPLYYKAVYPVNNLVESSREFNCEELSNLNMRTKCRVW